MAGTLAEIQRAFAQQQAALNALREELTDVRAEAAARVPVQTPAAAAPRVTVDTRLLGRPGEFRGEAEKWREWAMIFRGYATAASPWVADLMRKCEASDVD